MDGCKPQCLLYGPLLQVKTEDGSSVFNWIGRHWILLAGILCVIGLVTDLCVYIFRWKPYKVWKSFFTGSRNTDFRQPNANPKPTGSQKEKTGDIGQINRPAAEPAVRIRQDIPAESDFSRWETSDAEDTNDEIVQPEEKPATITNAGYIVPADSPYRRPAEEGIRTVETEQSDYYSPRAERKEPTPICLKVFGSRILLIIHPLNAHGMIANSEFGRVTLPKTNVSLNSSQFEGMFFV